MKCLQCGRQNDYRTRSSGGGACVHCRRRFVFEPREGDPLTDAGFHGAIEAVSVDGRLAWTDRHLYYEVARRLRRRRPLHRLMRRRHASIDPERFESLLQRWVAAAGPVEGRLRSPAFTDDVRREARAPDVADHGFERLLVCGSEGIVDALLANGFHGDHRCAVLAVTGYPEWAYRLLLPRLREDPPASVVVIHDADPEGCRLAARVRSDPRWFGGVRGVEVVDGGLRPADARPFRGLYLHGSAVAPAADVTEEEAKWLSRHRLELAAVAPRLLLGTVAELLARRENGDDDAGDDRWTAGDGWWAAAAWGDGGDDDVG